MKLQDKKDIKVNSIIVIESLHEERLTGKELYDTIISKFQSQEPSIYTKYVPISNKFDFFKLFNELEEFSIENNPVLHLETHGDSEGKGIVLSPSEDFISWKEIGSHLRRINVNLKNSLFVTLGICFGSGLEMCINPFKESPFFGFVTPQSSIYNDEILSGYTDFYNSLLLDSDLIKAIKLIKQNPKFVVYGSRKHFDEFKKIYLEDIEEEKLKMESETLLRKAISDLKRVLTQEQFSIETHKLMAERKKKYLNKLELLELKYFIKK